MKCTVTHLIMMEEHGPDVCQSSSDPCRSAPPPPAAGQRGLP